MENRLRNIALLIDADNASANAIDPVLTALAEFGAVNIRRAYGNWTKAGMKNWIENVNRYGIETRQQFDITKGKNATDMKMAIEAMDLLHRGHVDGFGIMSSDSDFMPLVTRLKQDGLAVYGFGRSSAPEGFREACTRFIDVDQLVAIASTSSEEAVSSGPLDQKIDPDVRALLFDVYDTVRHDDDGWTVLSAIGKMASNRSSFDVRSYGYKRLSDMIADMPEFELQRREGSDIVVRRYPSP